MKRSILMLAATLACAATDRPPPNILYIIADDLGYGDVQCLNPRRGKIQTPHLDRLATQGMAFTDMHSASSVCTPTRYGLLTGRYAWRTRLQTGVLDGLNDPPLIAADRVTLPGMLRSHGYRTAIIGKWHLGFETDAAVVSPQGKGREGLPVGARITGGPTTRGFDYFWGCSNARTITSLIEDDRVIEDLPPIEMLPRLTQRTVDYLSSHAKAAGPQPFFLFVALTSPHSPVVPSPEWKGKSELGPYGDFVMQTDDSVGRMLAALDQLDLAGNTLVVFTSDNGHANLPYLPDLEARGHFASAQFRGYKTDIWDGGHRIPFLVRWPGVVRPASQCSEILCLNDFMALAAELLGVALPDAAAPDSVSFLPLLKGRPLAHPRAPIVHHSQNGRFAIRDGPWKLNLTAGSGGNSAPTDEDALRRGMPEAQLYDVTHDAGETNNVIAAHRDVARRLEALLRDIVANGRSTPGPPQQNDVPVKLPEARSVTEK